MIKHIIFLSSSYSQKERIAYHVPIEQPLDIQKVVSAQNYIFENVSGKTQYSIYSVSTMDKTWESVVKLDRFYADVKMIPDIKCFVEIIQKDLEIEAMDVAKYIISSTNCTHLKLQKLLFLCYQKYLKLTDKKMFKDKIYAYDLGPVISSVYQEFKRTPGTVTLKNDDVIDDSYEYLAKKSRIIFARDGMKILSCIDEILQRYGHMDAKQLVSLTHRNGSAWKKVYKKYYYNKEIPDEIIKQSEC